MPVAKSAGVSETSAFTVKDVIPIVVLPLVVLIVRVEVLEVFPAVNETAAGLKLAVHPEGRAVTIDKFAVNAPVPLPRLMVIVKVALAVG